MHFQSSMMSLNQEQKRQQMNQQVTIFYNKYCPYAQRALIAAIEKDINANFVKTGLGQDSKTPQFKEAYSQSLGKDPKSVGKVPVLIHNNQHITESQIVCWYLAEAFSSGSQLIPADSMERAKMRVWINQVNQEMISLFDRAKKKQIVNIEDFFKEVDAFLQKVDNNIQGPFLLKGGISLADVLIYPWFQRWIIIEHYFEFPIPAKYTKIKQWLQALSKRPSIIETKKLTNDKYYIEATNKRMIAAAKL